jgi:hypothetical protein
MSYASGLAKLDPVNGTYRPCSFVNGSISDVYFSGLFGVIVPAFLYSIFGTCGQLNVGPEAALSLL